MKKLLLFLVVLVYSCGNTSYFEGVGIPARESNRGDYGIVNLDGELVVDFELDERPSIMVENWAHFENIDGGISYVNSQGEYVSTTHESSLLSNEGHVLVRLNDGQLALLNNELKLVHTLVGIEEAGSVSEGLIKVKNSDGYWGFINLQNQEVIKPKYYDVKSFREGLAVVMEEGEDEVLYGVIDTKGNEVIGMTSKYSYLTSFSEGLSIFEKDDRMGYLNTEGKEVISSDNWREAWPFFNGLATVEGSDREYGLIDTDGEFLIKTREFMPIKLYNDLAINRGSNRKYGFMDIDRKLVTRTEFEEIMPFLGQGAYAKDGSEWMYINKDGDDIGEFKESIRLLYHEEFTESIYKHNAPFDLDQTLSSTFVDLNAFYDEIIDPNYGFLSKFNNNENFDTDLLDGLIKDKFDLTTSSSVLDNISKYTSRIDTYAIYGTHMEYDENIKFSIRFYFDNTVVNKEKSDFRSVNPEAKLRSIRINLRFQNKGYGRGAELQGKLYAIINKKLNNEDWSDYYEDFYTSDGRTISLSSEYSNLYLIIDYPEVD